MSAKPAVEKDPALQEQTRLVRILEANLKVVTTAPEDLVFRNALIRRVIADLPIINQSLVTRIYDAACKIEFPQQLVVELRRVAELSIARALELKKPRSAKP